MANFNIPYKTEREGQMEFFDNYSKYRYLQQYNNRQLNKLRKQMADSPQQTQKLQDAYNTWNEWARSEYERVSNITYHEQQESIEKFGECLKEKWKGLMREAK